MWDNLEHLIHKSSSIIESPNLSQSQDLSRTKRINHRHQPKSGLLIQSCPLRRYIASEMELNWLPEGVTERWTACTIAHGWMWPKIFSHVIECRSAGVQVDSLLEIEKARGAPLGVRGVKEVSSRVPHKHTNSDTSRKTSEKKDRKKTT